jgi:Holliday junction resolvase RusA-like endonuclease
MTQTFTIPGQLPSFNQMSQSSRYDKSGKEATIAIAFLAEQCLNPLTGPADLQFHWVCKNRRRDKDNIVGGRKYILDALVMAKILPNDGWDWVGDFHDTFSVDRKNPRVIVTITLRRD